MKYLRTFTFIFIGGLLFSSCVKKENYPDVPQITFNSFTPFCSGATTDSAHLRVNFTDGNGAIGYPQGQQGAPNDFFIVPYFYVPSTQTFVPIVEGTDTITFAYSIPDITPTGSDKELNGIIQINMQDFFSTLPPTPGVNFNEFQFKVWMFDRANNKSNVITTPTEYSCQ